MEDQPNQEQSEGGQPAEEVDLREQAVLALQHAQGTVFALQQSEEETVPGLNLVMTRLTEAGLWLQRGLSMVFEAKKMAEQAAAEEPSEEPPAE